MSIPEPAAGEILLRVRACAVCRTDLHIVEGELRPPHLPLTPGHQAVAEVAALGANSTLPLGTRVGVPWLGWACGECVFCRRGEENLCRQARFTGLDRDGGFAEYLTAAEDFVLELPPDLPDEAAAPLLCAGIIGYRSLQRAEVAPGDTLGLIGFGASAHLALPVARHWGCRVFVFTRSEAHRTLARELGAEWAGGIDATAPAELDRAVLCALRRPGAARPRATAARERFHQRHPPADPAAAVFAYGNAPAVVATRRQTDGFS
jgi:propanol-preferring alcohol dehydrogenase